MRVINPKTRLLIADRENFQLKLYKRRPFSTEFRVKAVYSIAVGMIGHTTPAGLYKIHDKSNCPAWQMPESDWVPESEWGQILPCGDPNNPIRYRWMGVTNNGVGIHGIPPEEEESIGKAESHGCLRMHKDDVIELYPQVPVGTPIRIV